MFDYASIKQLARQIGRPTKDLVALSVVNDPFYAEVPHRHREGEWFAEIWERFGFSDRRGTGRQQKRCSRGYHRGGDRFTQEIASLRADGLDFSCLNVIH